MNITKLDRNDIGLFALAYAIAEQVFGVEPLKANSKKQKKIRKWVIKNYVVYDDLSPELLSFVDSSKTDLEIIEFMAECSKYMAERDALKRQRFEEAVADFSEDVKKAFTYLFETVDSCENIVRLEDKVVFTLDECDAYDRKLILHTSVGNHIEEFDMVSYVSEIVKEGTRYKMVCMAENFKEESSFPITVFFDNATVEIDIYRVDRSEFGSTPWNTLTSMACEILSKRDLGNGYFNQKEIELMPLMKELCGLALFSRLLDEEPPSFEIFKQYITKYKLSKILPLLEKIEQEYTNFNKRQRLLISLHNKLNKKCCEGLWRELYNLIADTQFGYNDKIILADQEKLSKIKKQLEQRFHSFGYKGEYPTFQKEGAIKGIKLEESYNQTYFIGFKKNVEHIIHCKESIYNGQLQIQFLCGTALLKNNESTVDIYSCCFNANGKRLFKSVVLFEEDHTGSDIFERLDQYAQIAAKRAECTKLDKNEYELLGDDSKAYTTFLSVLFFMGGLFAVGMTIGMIIFVAIVTALDEGCAAIPETIGIIPWGLLFLFSFLGFGVPMAIIETKVKRK